MPVSEEHRLDKFSHHHHLLEGHNHRNQPNSATIERHQMQQRQLYTIKEWNNLLQQWHYNSLSVSKMYVWTISTPQTNLTWTPNPLLTAMPSWVPRYHTPPPLPQASLVLKPSPCTDHPLGHQQFQQWTNEPSKSSSISTFKQIMANSSIPWVVRFMVRFQFWMRGI